MPENTVSPGASADMTPQVTASPAGYPGNVIDAAVPAAKITQMNSAIDTLYGVVNGIKVAVTPEQLKRLPKVGTQRLDFARAVVERFKNHSEMGGDLITAAQLLIDLADVENLTPLRNRIREIDQALSDRIAVAEGELYQGSLVAYHNNHARAGLGDSTAKEIDHDLKGHFSKTHKPKDEKKPTQDDATQTDP